MEKNLPEDNLEAFFKKSLQKQSSKPRLDGWDTPDDTVWDEIATVVQPVERNDRRLLFFKWWAIAATLALLIIMYQLHSSHQRITTLTEQVEKNTMTIENIDSQLVTQSDKKSNDNLNKTDLNKNLNPISEEANFHPPQKINRQSSTNFATPPINTITDNFNVSESITSLTQKHSTSSNTLLDTQSVSDGGSTFDNTENINPIKQKNITDSSTVSQGSSENISNHNQDINNQSLADNELALLPSISTSLQTSTSVLPNIKPLNTTPLDYFKSQFYLGARTIFNASTRSLRSRDGGLDRIRRLREQEEERNKMSFGANIGFQFHKNWSLEIGVQQGKSTIRSLHKTELQFQRNLEQVNPANDRLESQYPLALSTSYGDVSTDISLSRSQGSTVRDGSVILVGIETSQDINYIDLPLLVKYQIQVGKLHLGAKTGLSMRLIGNSQVETLNIRTFPQVDFIRPQLARRITRALDKKPNSSLNYVVGLNMEYALTSQLRLALESIFTRSFKPVFAKGAVETFAQTASLQVGLNYYF